MTMKVLPFIIPKPEKANVILQEDKGTSFYDKLHQHHEIQLSCILKGEGKFYIGDHFGHFHSGDIFVIGQNLPHIFSNEISEEGVRMISLFFTPDSYGQEFFDYPEFKSIRSLLRIVQSGIQLLSNVELAREKFLRMQNESTFDRFISFMKLLELISRSEVLTLSSSMYYPKLQEEEGKRMRDIMDYTFGNFQNNLSVIQVAEVANMTPNAFSRYFKHRTNKTYIKFLLDIRIGHACNLLARNKDLSISEIAYTSGFNNLTNFNRKFKQYKGMTPSQYKRDIGSN